MKTDSIFYEIFQSEPTIICELLGKTDPRTSAYSFGSQEVKETSFRLDGILVPPLRMPDLPIIFVEAQGYPDNKGTLYSSFFSEIFLYLHDYQPVNDWESVLIFTKRSLDPGLPKQYSDFVDSTHFQRVYLDELHDSEDLSLGLSLLKLVVSSQKEAAALSRQLVKRSRTEFSDVRRQQNFVELVVTTLFYKFESIDRAEIEAMLITPRMRKSNLFQYVKDEGREEGREEAREEMMMSAVSALLKVDIPIEKAAELLETDLYRTQRAAIPYLLKTDMQLSQISEQWDLPLAEVENMAIASLSIRNIVPEEIASRLNMDLQKVQRVLENQ